MELDFQEDWAAEEIKYFWAQMWKSWRTDRVIVRFQWINRFEVCLVHKHYLSCSWYEFTQCESTKG